MRKYQDADWLREQYIDKRRSMRSIGRECGVGHATVLKWLRRFKIPTRSLRESVMGKKRLSKEERIKKLMELAKEIEELEEFLLNPFPSESEVKRRIRIEHGKRRKAELEALRRQIEKENQRAGGSWSFGEVEDQLRDIQTEHDEPSDRPNKVTQK